jgi:6-phosphogluconolactonase (cycloisomerase 2 family)
MRAEVRYVGTESAIEVRQGGRLVQTVPSENPSFLALDANRKLLFVVNEISQYQGLPAGSVESHSVHPQTGLLSLVSRQALSLSAIKPRSLAISPDGKFLAVAVYGGGAYNVLPIRANGEIGPVTQILKEIGRGPHPTEQATAHPHSLIFHPSGRFVIASDVGMDRISVFAFHDGRMVRLNQIQTPAGSGPGHLELGSDGSRIFVRHQLTGRHCSYQFNPRTGCLA